MSPPRLTIAGIMGMIVFVAGVIALLRYSNEEIEGIACGTTTAILLVSAAMQARFGGMERRAWWFGFAAFGLATLMLGYATRTSDWPMHWLNGPILERMPLREDIRGTGGDNFLLGMAQHEFRGHALMILIAAESLLAGWIGGFIAEAISPRARRRDGESRPGDSGPPASIPSHTDGASRRP